MRDQPSLYARIDIFFPAHGNGDYAWSAVGNKYIVVVDDDVDVHSTSEVLFRLCANTDPQRDSIFTKGPADVLDHATSEIAIGSKLGIDVTKKLPGEGFKRPGRR